MNQKCISVANVLNEGIDARRNDKLCQRRGLLSSGSIGNGLYR